MKSGYDIKPIFHDFIVQILLIGYIIFFNSISVAKKVLDHLFLIKLCMCIFFIYILFVNVQDYLTILIIKILELDIEP